MRNTAYDCCICLAIYWELSGALILCAKVEVAWAGLVRSNAAAWPFDVQISPAENDPRGQLVLGEGLLKPGCASIFLSERRETVDGGHCY